MEWHEMAEQASQASPAVALAVLGGMLKWVAVGKRTWRAFFLAFAGAGFSGFLAHLALLGCSMPEGLRAVVIALVGYSGGAIIDLATGRLCRIVAGR